MKKILTRLKLPTLLSLFLTFFITTVAHAEIFECAFTDGSKGKILVHESTADYFDWHKGAAGWQSGNYFGRPIQISKDSIIIDNRDTLKKTINETYKFSGFTWDPSVAPNEGTCVLVNYKNTVTIFKHSMGIASGDHVQWSDIRDAEKAAIQSCTDVGGIVVNIQCDKIDLNNVGDPVRYVRGNSNACLVTCKLP